MIGRETVPVLARLLVRMGSPDAPAMLDLADQHARRADVLEWLVPTGLAHLEYAWLTGAPDRAGDYPQLLRARTDRAGTELQRGEVLRYLRRLGLPAEPFDGCPDPYAAGLRGDWRAAADAWAARGEPYEQALELVDSGDVASTRDAFAVLDRLGAHPAAALARSRLRRLGVSRLPRRTHPATAVNPAGLTARQLEILRLLADGGSNAEIADTLVVSTRTVDHHVSAILRKLDVQTRARAIAKAAASGIVAPRA